MSNAPIGLKRRFAIAVMSVAGLSSVALALADPTVPDAGAIIADPTPVALVSTDLRLTTALAQLERLVDEASQLEMQSSEKVFTSEPIEGLNTSIESAQLWLDAAGSANASGVLPDQAEALVESTSVKQEELQASIAEVESAVAAWDKDQKIMAEVAPIFDGGEAAVSVWDLQTHQPIIQYNADTPWTPGSTYKLFTAYSILRAIDGGEISADNVVGWSLDSCFYDMILVSDNNCAQDWLSAVGFDRVEAEAHQLGMTDTYFVPGSLVTTANDLSLFMTKLHDGAFLSEQSREYLKNALFTHIHRYAIPAAMPESDTVMDKVGFVFGYMNDTAVIFTPNGDYTMTIMTNGLDWEQIRQAAATIREYL